MTSVAARRGVTLVELLVVIALLGVTAAVAGLSARPLTRVPATGEIGALIAATRRHALNSGRPVTVRVTSAGRPGELTAHPDGSVIADPWIVVDRLTGEAPRDSF